MKRYLILDAMGVVFCDKFDHEKFMPYFLQNAKLCGEGNKEEEIYHWYRELTKGVISSQQFFTRLGINNPDFGFLLNLKLDLGFKEFAEKIKGLGLKSVILSNDSQEWANYRNMEIGLTQLIDYYLTSSIFGVRKPEQKIYEKMIWFLGAEPEECIYVDDLTDNLIEPAKLGISIVHFSREAKEDCKFPVVKDFSRLYDHIKGQCNE